METLQVEEFINWLKEIYKIFLIQKSLRINKDKVNCYQIKGESFCLKGEIEYALGMMRQTKY